MKSVLTYLLFAMILVGCVREPPLHLHRGQPVEMYIPIVELDLKVFWQTDIGVDYDWEKEWTYGWDAEDEKLFGPLGYTYPEVYNLRRYFNNDQKQALHTHREPFELYSTHFQAEYNFGYYDILAWNRIAPPDVVRSVVEDEETTLDSVMVFTNNTTVRSRYDAHYHQAASGLPTYSYGSPNYDYAFHEPEQVFSAYERDVYISRNMDDYDYYDEVNHIYYKYVNMTLLPVTYIYLTQVRLHHNNGRIDGVDGNANISGMARGASLNSGLSTHDPITVHYSTRFKKNVVMNQECHHVNHGILGEDCQYVDIAGGRVMTFGIPNQNSSRVTRAEDVKDDIRHYMDMTLLFNNGLDSTFVFDVTDQVRKHYRGGVITIDLDVDTIPIPSRSGGSGFDAVVEDYEEETHEFEMKPQRPQLSGQQPIDNNNNKNNNTQQHEKSNSEDIAGDDNYRHDRLYKRRLRW